MKVIVLTLVALSFLTGIPILTASMVKEPIYLSDGGDYDSGGG